MEITNISSASAKEKICKYVLSEFDGNSFLRTIGLFTPLILSPGAMLALQYQESLYEAGAL